MFHSELLRFFDHHHLPPALQVISAPFHDLAHQIANSWTPDVMGSEIEMALRKLLESKDCAVRAHVRPR